VQWQTFERLGLDMQAHAQQTHLTTEMQDFVQQKCVIFVEAVATHL
jgi:hypothetical protein